MTAWHKLIEQQLVVNNQCYEACILSKQNAVPWACSPGFIPRKYNALVQKDDGTEAHVDVNEAANLVEWISTGTQPAHGLRFNGEKFMVVRSDSSGDSFFVNGRKGNMGIGIYTSSQCIVVGTYSESEGQAAAVCFDAVQKVADFLSRNDL